MWGCAGLHGGLVGMWFLMNNGLIEISKDAPMLLVGSGNINTIPLGGFYGITLLIMMFFILTNEEESEKEETYNTTDIIRKHQFDHNIDLGIDPSDIETLREQADFDFDNESLNDEDLQAFLQHVMLSEKNNANMDSQGIQQEDEPFYHVSQRQEALSLATPLVNAFYNEGTERQCFGHKDKIFGVAFSPCGQFFATASEDSTVKIWNLNSPKKRFFLSVCIAIGVSKCLR